MSKNTKIHEFYPCIYPRRVWVVKGFSQRRIQEAFSLRDGSNIAFENDTGNEALCTVFPGVMLKENRKYGILVAINAGLGIGDIAHEAVHVALEIFYDVRASIEHDNQEPYAYLVGWVADCIYQVKTGKFKD